MYLIHLLNMQYENVTTDSYLLLVAACGQNSLEPPVHDFTWYSHDVVHAFMHTQNAQLI